MHRGDIALRLPRSGEPAGSLPRPPAPERGQLPR